MPTHSEVSTVTTSTQTEVTTACTDQEFELLVKQNRLLSSKIFSVHIIQGNNETTKFYTDLPTYGLFVHVFEFLAPFVTASH